MNSEYGAYSFFFCTRRLLLTVSISRTEYARLGLLKYIGSSERYPDGHRWGKYLAGGAAIRSAPSHHASQTHSCYPIHVCVMFNTSVVFPLSAFHCLQLPFLTISLLAQVFYVYSFSPHPRDLYPSRLTITHHFTLSFLAGV